MKHHRTYLSREMTRAMALDHPIGDPFGGPAYGEKNWPAVTIVGAAMTIEVGLTVGGIVGGLMVAGGVLSGLGAITGDETLSKLGMVAGLAGGAMGMMGVGMNGASFADLASSAFTDDKGISGMLGMGGEATSQAGIVTGTEGLGTTAGESLETFAAPPSSLSADSTTTAGSSSNFFGGDSVVDKGMNNTGVSVSDFNNTGSNGANFIGLDLAKSANPAAATQSGGLLSSFLPSSDLGKYMAMNGIADFAKSLATAPTDDQIQQAEAKLAADTGLTDAQRAKIQYEIDLAKQKTTNQNSTAFAQFVPKINQAAAPIQQA